MTRRDLFKRAMGLLAAVPCLKWLGEPSVKAVLAEPLVQGGTCAALIYFPWKVSFQLRCGSEFSLPYVVWATDVRNAMKYGPRLAGDVVSKRVEQSPYFEPFTLEEA